MSFSVLERLVWISPPQGGVDREFLTGFQKGFAGTGVSETTLLVYLVAVLFVLALIALLVHRILRPRAHRFWKAGPHQVQDPERIRDIIDDSIVLRSIYDMEVFDEAYREMYKGVVLGVDDEGRIEMELTTFTDPNLDFVNKPARIAFRTTKKGETRFYQFDTFTKSVALTDKYGRRERVVRMNLPTMLEQDQKRRYARIMPSGKFSFEVDIVRPDMPTNPVPLAGFRRIHEAEVRDISLGGIQLVVNSRIGDLRVSPGREVYINFTLPMRELQLQSLPRAFFIKCQVISIMRESTGRRVMSRLADETTIGPNLVRMRFIGKGMVDWSKKTVSFHQATSMSFEDLSRWLQAYQRHLIQKEKGLLPDANRPQNIYPSRKPDVKPKYPPHKVHRHQK